MHRHPGLDQGTGVHFPLDHIDLIHRSRHHGGLIEELLLAVGALFKRLLVQGSGLVIDRLAVGIKVMEDDGGQLAITKLDDLAASVASSRILSSITTLELAVVAKPHYFGASPRDTQRRVCFLFSLSAAFGAAVLSGTVAALYQPLYSGVFQSAISVWLPASAGRIARSVSTHQFSGTP